MKKPFSQATKSQPSQTTSPKMMTQTELAKTNYARSQRLLAICDEKITRLEQDADAREALPVRDLRSLAKTVHDLQHDLQSYIEITEAAQPEISSGETFLEKMFHNASSARMAESVPINEHLKMEAKALLHATDENSIALNLDPLPVIDEGNSPYSFDLFRDNN